MEILGKYGKEELAILYIARYDKKIIEFVESVQPPVSREQKWVLILSTLYGCPMGCLMCDASDYFFGKISKEGMLAQIDHMISPRFPDKKMETYCQQGEVFLQLLEEKLNKTKYFISNTFNFMF